MIYSLQPKSKKLMRLNKTIILSYFSVLISGYAFSEDFCKRDLKALTKVYNVNNKLAVETRQISNANFELNSIFIDIVHVIESESISANLLIKMISKDSEILFNPKVSDLLGIDEISQSILEVSGLKSVNELYLKLDF